MLVQNVVPQHPGIKVSAYVPIRLLKFSKRSPFGLSFSLQYSHRSVMTLRYCHLLRFHSLIDIPSAGSVQNTQRHVTSSRRDISDAMVGVATRSGATCDDQVIPGTEPEIVGRRKLAASVPACAAVGFSLIRLL